MKKTIYSSLALGAVLGLASCASDEPLGNNQNDGSVTFTVALPEMATRAFGDANTINCNELLYTVYDAEGNTVILPTETKTAFGQGVLTDNVTLQLVANQEYKIVFYAHNNGSQFSTYADGKLTVDYTKANINSEIDDAFYAAYAFTADGNAKTVTLTRPFAQLNIGTNDLGEAAVQKILANITSTLTVSQGLYTGMDLIAGTTSDEDATTGDVTFTPTVAPAVNTDFPVTGYSNLLSVYLLVPKDQSIIDATYVLNNGEKEIRTLNLASTPVQMNYRTNVYGSLLTTQQPFNVEIEPNFGDEFNQEVPTTYELKPGQTIEEVAATLPEGKHSLIKLPEGEFVLPLAAYKGDITLEGSGENTKLTYTGVTGASEGQLNYSADGKKITFRNLTLSFPANNNYTGFARATLTAENCKITGRHNSYGPSVYRKCEFSNSGDYNMWAYGADTRYEDCTFNNDLGKMVNVYCEQDADKYVSMKNCKFINTGAEAKPAVKINSTYAPNHLYTVDLRNCTIEGNFPDNGENYHGLWGIDANDTGSKNQKVIVDGVVVNNPKNL